MAHIAERRDLDDERLIIEFARLVGDEDLLKMLYLLTYLDINAVGPQVWTDWKGTLLWELFIKTHTILTRGVPEGEEEHRQAAQSPGGLGGRTGRRLRRGGRAAALGPDAHSLRAEHVQRQGGPASPT